MLPFNPGLNVNQVRKDDPFFQNNSGDKEICLNLPLVNVTCVNLGCKPRSNASGCSIITALSYIYICASFVDYKYIYIYTLWMSPNREFRSAPDGPIPRPVDR